ncbi:ATP-binding protein [Magnetospirillum sp. UT-4]|uniref:hybrid sensor histidine kinase/response regulator n=1 Tax=Magnetospirillum sp. UT-4 TaxID=2681467 RepID=UPI00137F76E4|nr:ATP-binding protein [Magnetospirillum sp. UT-4]CAA7620139.1 putative Histidine kinase [Magnetospirillum sp. UT-4]
MAQSLRVLVVDDCEDDALLLVHRIRAAGYRVEHACVCTAVDMATALAQGDWDVVVSDVRMPGFGAAGALELYKTAGGCCPFIVVSGVITEEAAVTLLKAGAHDFVLKSNLARLVPAIERELREVEGRRARQAIERALRLSEERYALAAKGANDGLWDWDLDSGRVFYSPRWHQMLGLAEGQAAATITAWLDRVHPDDLGGVRGVLEEHLNGASNQFSAEHRLRDAAGRWRWMLARGMAVRDEGRPRRVVGSLTDTTLYREAVEASDRALAAKVRFLAAASHDLRQPVQALFCFSAVLGDALGGHPAAPVVAELDGALSGLKSLLDSLLDVSRIDAGLISPARERFPLCRLTDALAAEIAPLAERKGLGFRYLPCHGMVDTDPVLLGRILRNLLANALSYTERGRILMGCRRRGDRVAVVVADTGIGIAGDQRRQIFEEFYQIANTERDRRKGLGLGLSIAQRLAGLLGARIDVASTPGRGSCFSVILPFIPPGQ